MYKVCKRPPTTSAVQSTPHVRGDFKKCSRLLKCKRFQSTPRRATSGAYLVSSRTAAVNPTAKACFCQSSHSCNRASSVPAAACPTVCAGFPAQTSPALACIALHTGLLILVSCSPLDFSRLVCYHRFRSVSALCWVVSATVW